MEAVRNRENLLQKVPYRLRRGRVVDGRVHIVMPKYHEGLRRRLAAAIGLPLEITIRLDSRSSRVWALIDGKRTVREIGREMKAQFGESIEPLYGYLATLLMIMERNGLIAYRRRRARRRPRPRGGRAVGEDAGDTARAGEEDTATGGHRDRSGGADATGHRVGTAAKGAATDRGSDPGRPDDRE